MIRRFTVPAIALSTLITSAGPSAFAQDKAIERLDRDVMVEKLRDFGMNELLLHMADVEQFGDPADKTRLRIDVLIVQAKDESRDLAARVASAKQAVDELQRLIDDNFDHLKRPVWQTELAETIQYLLMLQLQQAGDAFYIYGVPQADQKRTFEQRAPQCYVNLKQADRRFFRMVGDIPKQQELFAQLQANGQWDRMIREFYETRTRFLLARSAFLVAHLPNSHEYYLNLGKSPDLQPQAATPDGERKRLLSEVLDNLDKIDSAQVQKFGLTEPMKLLRGQAMVFSNKIDPGMKELREFKGEGIYAVIADVATAYAIDRTGQHTEALSYLDELTSRPPVSTTPLFLLLATDAKHRLLLAKAMATTNNQAQAIEAAYAPYTQMFDDPTLGDRADQMRALVYRRWAETTPREQWAQVPSMVQMAIAETFRIEGQNLIAGAVVDEQAGRDAAAAAKRAEAIGDPDGGHPGPLPKAIEVADMLLTRTDVPVPNAVAARAMYNKGFAQYLLSPGSLGNVLAASKTFTELADKYADQPISEEAIKIALDLVRPLADPNKQDIPANVRKPATDAYIAAADVLLEKFPNSGVAAGERLFYAFHILQSKRNYEKAVEVYKLVPQGHPDYVPARGEMIFCLQELFKSTSDAATQQKWANELREAATGLQQLVEQELQNRDNLPPKRLLELEKAQATLLMARAVVDARMGRPADALVALKDFEQDFAGEEFTDMRRDALDIQIQSKIAAGKFQEAVADAERMMQTFPGQNSAAVIDGVLRYLDQQIAQAKGQMAQLRSGPGFDSAQQRARQMAQTANQMADMLLAWARQQPQITREQQEQGAEGVTDEQMVMFVRIKAKALSMIGQADQAVALLEPYASEYPTDAGLRFSIAEAHYFDGAEATGIGEDGVPNGVASLKTALSQFNELIAQLYEIQDQVQTDAELRNVYWQSWMRVLQTIDLLNEKLKLTPSAPNPYEKLADEIPLRIKQLQLEDLNLGGEPYKTELQRLMRKYA